MSTGAGPLGPALRLPAPGVVRSFGRRSLGTPVVLDGGHTPVKIIFRLRLQNLFPGVCPPSVTKGKWLAGVLCCACLKVEAMVSMSVRGSKGGGYGLNV